LSLDRFGDERDLDGAGTGEAGLSAARSFMAVNGDDGLACAAVDGLDGDNTFTCAYSEDKGFYFHLSMSLSTPRQWGERRRGEGRWGTREVGREGKG
jgi:hypothetical protein